MSKDWQKVVHSMNEVLYGYYGAASALIEDAVGLLPEITLIGGVIVVTWWYW